MIYATIIWKSFHRDGVQNRVELVPIHSINRSVTAVSKEHTFTKYGRIDHFWVIKPLKSQEESVKNAYIITPDCP